VATQPLFVHPALIEIAESKLQEAKKAGALTDFRVLACGDDLELIMSHKKGCDNGEVHGLAWETFEEATRNCQEAQALWGRSGPACRCLQRQHSGAWGQVWRDGVHREDIRAHSRFYDGQDEPGAFNLPIFKIFADPFNTAGLVIDPACHHGFVFEIWTSWSTRRSS